MSVMYKKFNRVRVAHAKSVGEIACKIFDNLDGYNSSIHMKTGWTTKGKKGAIPYCAVYDGEIGQSPILFAVYLHLADRITEHDAGLEFIVENKATNPADLHQALKQARSDFASNYN